MCYQQSSVANRSEQRTRHNTHWGCILDEAHSVSLDNVSEVILLIVIPMFLGNSIVTDCVAIEPAETSGEKS